MERAGVGGGGNSCRERHRYKYLLTPVLDSHCLVLLYNILHAAAAAAFVCEREGSRISSFLFILCMGDIIAASFHLLWACGTLTVCRVENSATPYVQTYDSLSWKVIWHASYTLKLSQGNYPLKIYVISCLQWRLQYVGCTSTALKVCISGTYLMPTTLNRSAASHHFVQTHV